jgi:hypothetical protein
MAQKAKKEGALRSSLVVTDETVVTLDDEGWAQLMEALERPPGAFLPSPLYCVERPLGIKLSGRRAGSPTDGAERSSAHRPRGKTLELVQNVLFDSKKVFSR